MQNNNDGRFYDWMSESIPSSIFVSILVTINWTFTLKSKGFLKTEEEWYAFGAFLMNVIPTIMATVIILFIVTYPVFYSVERLYRFFTNKNKGE